MCQAHDLNLLTILDAKRNDIGSTEEAYLDAILGQLGFDAMTENIYLGDTFMSAKNAMGLFGRGKEIFRMVRTSNPEGFELQDQELKTGELVYEWAASEAGRLDRVISELTNGVGSIGGVVGATVPDQAVRCRELAPDIMFLIPGYGAQGAAADDAVRGFPKDGRLLGTVNSSRGITLKSWKDKPGDPMEHIAAAIDAANVELNEALERWLGFDPYKSAA